MSSEKYIKDVVSRVAAEIDKEAIANQGNFRVSDLSDQLKTLATGGEVAWTISYSTSAVADLGAVVRPSDVVAWTISYSTSSVAVRGAKEGLK